MITMCTVINICAHEALIIILISFTLKAYIKAYIKKHTKKCSQHAEKGNNAVLDGCRFEGYKWDGWIGLDWPLGRAMLLSSFGANNWLMSSTSIAYIKSYIKA